MSAPARTVPGMLRELETKALFAGAALVLFSMAWGLLFRGATFFRGYLVSYFFWLAPTLGAMGWLMIHHLSGGGWGYVIRRPLEAAAKTVPLMAVLFLPILFGMHHIYEWATPEAAHDPVLQSKAAYLNPLGFAVRAVVYFIIWGVLAWRLIEASRAQDEEPGPAASARLRRLSGPGIVIYVLSFTFAAVDWGMSLEPHWFSSIYGAIFAVGQGLSTMALAIVATAWLAGRRPLDQELTVRRLHDLGKLLFAFTVLWAYLNVSQLIIIWSANLPEEITWYLRRSQGGWKQFAFLVVALQFVIPFFVLLSRHTKRNVRLLVPMCAVILVARYFDLYLWLAPPFSAVPAFRPHLVDLTAFAGIGGLWLAWFCRMLRGLPLIALGDASFSPAAQVKEAPAHG